MKTTVVNVNETLSLMYCILVDSYSGYMFVKQDT